MDNKTFYVVILLAYATPVLNQNSFYTKGCELPLVIESEDSIRETLEFCNLHIPLSTGDPLHPRECTSVLIELTFFTVNVV